MIITLLTGKITLRSALHIGNGNTDSMTDAPIRRDTSGRIVLPGTSLAGVLRAAAEKIAPRLATADHRPKVCKNVANGQKGLGSGTCGCLVCSLFGDINPVDEEVSKTGAATASQLWINDARLADGQDCSPVIQDHLGVDRTTGVANRAEQAKYDKEILPAGAQFILRLEHRGLDSEQALLLDLILAEAEAGRMYLGGGKARGLGAFRLSNIEERQWDLSNKSELIEYLWINDRWEGADAQEKTEVKGRQQQWTTKAVARTSLSTCAYAEVKQRFTSDHGVVARTFVRIDIRLASEYPMLLADSVSCAKTGFDHSPLLTGGKPIIPGSSLRGMLRSQAERILRTMTMQLFPNDGLAFAKHCPACDSLVKDTNKPLASCDAKLRAEGIEGDRAVLADNQLCLACSMFGSVRGGSRLLVEEGHYSGQTPPIYKAFDFLAIDRFTGGGRDGAKFDALTLANPDFECSLFFENPTPWELGLLLLTLRDIDDGLVSLGFGGAKGFGQLEMRRCQLTIGYIDQDDLAVLAPYGDAAAVLSSNKTGGDTGIFRTVTYEQIPEQLEKQWRQALVEKINDFRRDEVIRYSPATDSYFRADGAPNELYPAGCGIGRNTI